MSDRSFFDKLKERPPLMKRQRLLIALICLLLPILLRTLWYYRGFYFGNSNIQTPDYSAFSVAQPTLSTPAAVEYTSSTQKAVVLFDQAHFNNYTTAEIESLRNQILAMGAEVVILDGQSDLPDQIKKADAFVIITPTIEYSSEEIEAVEEFVHRGGRLLVIADPTRSYSEYDTEREESVILVNDILQPYLLSFRNDYVYNLSHNEGNYRNTYVYPTGKTDLTSSISELVFYAAHSLDINSQKIIIGEDSTLSSLDDMGGELPVAALDSSGNVLAIGDMTFMTNPYYQVSDNFQFVQNIGNFLINGDRVRNLYDFPNLFNQTIAIQLNSGITLDQDLLTEVADIKKSYSREDLEVILSEQAEAGFDRIVLGTYPPDEDLYEEIEDFGIIFDNTHPTSTPTPAEDESTEDQAESLIETNNGYNGGKVTGRYYQVPGIGNIPTKGFGFILFKQDEEGDSLFFLADSQENATVLLHLLVSGSLDKCLVTDTIAVCEQNAVATLEETEEFFDYDILEEGEEEGSPEYTTTPEPSPTPTPLITMTPSG